MSAEEKPTEVLIEYDPVRIVGRIIRQPDQAESLWTRLISRSVDDPDSRQLGANELEFPWPAVLSILRDFGTRTQQQLLGFRFRFLGEAAELARKFAEEIRAAKAARSNLTITLSVDEARANLVHAGYTRRVLREFQERDLLRLVTMRNGANFSVPGAGKTSVTLALHMLVRREGHHLMVFGPKASFPAWQSVVEECVDPEGNPESAEPFTLLSGGADENEQLLRSGATRFLMSYDLMIRQQDVLSAYLARQPVHVVLDEAHRMKAGFDSQRGAFLLNVAPLAGYDVLSFDEGVAGPVNKLIEVKSTIASPLRFYLTRNEWEKARNAQASYVFHVWNLSASPPRLYEIAGSGISSDIPLDQGNGRWSNVEIPISC